MKRILVPIDFSESALNALSYARMLFSSVSCEFYLLHASNSYPLNLLIEEHDEELYDAVLDQSIKDLEELLNAIKKENKNSFHEFKMISSSNSMISALNSVIALHNIDLIIMGTKGAKSLADIFLGSNAVRVITEVDDCPIIVVPQNYSVKTPTQIVFSTNFKRAFDLNELNPLISLTKLIGATLKIVQIMVEESLNDFQKENKENLKMLFKDMNYFFYKIDVLTSESQSIRDFITKTESDMIAFVNHKQNFFHKLTEENVIKKVSFNSPVPVLILSELN